MYKINVAVIYLEISTATIFMYAFFPFICIYFLPFAKFATFLK